MEWILPAIVVAGPAGLLLLLRAGLVPAEKAGRLLRQGALVVDVREASEYAAEHVPGALNLPLGTLAVEAPSRIRDHQQVVLLHCLSGGRSGIAARRLKAMGYANAFNLGSFRRARHIIAAAQSTA